MDEIGRFAHHILLVTEMSVAMSLSVSKRNVKGRRLHAFLQWMGGEFTLKPLNPDAPARPLLPFLFNLILTLLDQPASVGGRLFCPGC